MSSAHVPDTLEELVARLAATIGLEKSREVVASAVQTLGSFDADAVLKIVGKHAGIVGVAARFARTRMAMRAASLFPRAVGRPEPPLGLAPGPPQPGGELEQTGTIQCRVIIELFASSLGEEASEELVLAGLRQLGIEGQEFDKNTAIRLLGALATLPGLPGIAARFAKARVILLFGFEKTTTTTRT
jgi:hypothetical protein